jgi:hypothetical protein
MSTAFSDASHPVIACVDGGPDGDRALRYAIREVARRGTGLRLVHVPLEFIPYAPLTPGFPMPDLREIGSAILRPNQLSAIPREVLIDDASNPAWALSQDSLAHRLRQATAQVSKCRRISHDLDRVLRIDLRQRSSHRARTLVDAMTGEDSCRWERPLCPCFHLGTQKAHAVPTVPNVDGDPRGQLTQGRH